jgi:hypothetical protein
MQRKQTVHRRLAGSNLHLMPSNGDKATLQHHADRTTMVPLPNNHLPLLTYRSLGRERTRTRFGGRGGLKEDRESTKHTRGFQQDPIFCLEYKSGKTIGYVFRSIARMISTVIGRSMVRRGFSDGILAGGVSLPECQTTNSWSMSGQIFLALPGDLRSVNEKDKDRWQEGYPFEG